MHSVVLAHCEDNGLAVLTVDLVLALREGPIEEEHFVVWSEVVYVCRPSSEGGGGECTHERQCMSTAYLMEFQG